MLKWRLHRLVRVYTCQNATLLEITCHGSNISVIARHRLKYVTSIQLHKLQVQHNGSMVEVWTRHQRVASSRLNRGTVLCPRARRLILCLVLVQLRNTGNHPDMTEKLLTWILSINTKCSCEMKRM